MFRACYAMFIGVRSANTAEEDWLAADEHGSSDLVVERTLI